MFGPTPKMNPSGDTVLTEPQFRSTMNREWIKPIRALGLLLLVVAYGAFFVDVIPFPSQLRFDRQGVSRKLTLDNLAAEYRKGCPKHQFESIQLLSRSPQMMLISGFMTEVEAEFLVRIAY
jgi:hypothetical protein